MKKYIELRIKGAKEDIKSFVEGLKSFSSDAFVFKEIREINTIDDGHYVEFHAKRAIDYKSRVVLLWDERGLRMCNIIPKTISFLEMEQYNAVLKHFYEDVVVHSNLQQLQVDISKEENSMKDLISAPAYHALELWEEMCNKNAPTAHPNDRERWMDFICELVINKDELSLSDFRNWLIEDKGWCYNPEEDDDRTFIDLELDLEFGQDLIECYAKKTHIE